MRHEIFIRSLSCFTHPNNRHFVSPRHMRWQRILDFIALHQRFTISTRLSRNSISMKSLTHDVPREKRCRQRFLTCLRINVTTRFKDELVMRTALSSHLWFNEPHREIIGRLCSSSLDCASEIPMTRCKHLIWIFRRKLEDLSSVILIKHWTSKAMTRNDKIKVLLPYRLPEILYFPLTSFFLSSI